MGTFFLLLTKNNNIEKYKLNLENNQQIFLTPYDIHETLLHIIFGKNKNLNDLKDKFSFNNKGNSVFLDINESERICEKYDDWLDSNFCICSKK